MNNKENEPLIQLLKRKKTKIQLFIDMDGALADFDGSDRFQSYDPYMHSPPRMYEKGFFENLKPVDGAIWGIKMLQKSEMYDIHILSKPVKDSPYCYYEKCAWILKYFPGLEKNMHLSQEKGLLSKEGRILIDDDINKWKEPWEVNGGDFIWFSKNAFVYDETDHDRSYFAPGSNREVWELIVGHLTGLQTIESHGDFSRNRIRRIYD